MKIAVMAGLLAERDMDVHATGVVRHSVGLHSFVWMRCLRHVYFLALWLLAVGAWELRGQTGYTIVWHPVGEDTLREWRGRPLPERFRDRQECEAWLAGLAPSLQSVGRLEASMDSVWHGVSGAHVWLHAGPVYVWSSFEVGADAVRWLEAGGWGYWPKAGAMADFSAFRRSSEQWLRWMDDHGYPFAFVGIDSVRTSKGLLAGRLRADPGPLYHIDSIVVSGPVAIRRRYLERHLGINGGDVYQKRLLEDVSVRLGELGFLRESAPWSLTMVGTGATLNLYLESRKASQVNVLAGLMPDNIQTGGRLLLTGEASADLRNAFGRGEHLKAQWQQIQYRSPRLRLSFLQPFVAGSGMGLDVQLDLLRKDSSYLNIQAGLGLQFLQTSRRSGRIGYQQFSTRLLEVDTLRIRATRALPEFNDAVNHLGYLDYRYTGTDDRLQPRRGREASLMVGAGLRRIREHPSVMALTKDASGQVFDFRSLYDTLSKSRALGRLQASMSQYIPMGRQSVMRLALQGGMVWASGIFRNELFQIGGLRSLRGFDEESLFASDYAVATAEYRLLVGGRSFFYAFLDAGQVGCKAWRVDTRSFYMGTGLGIALETKAGMLNLAYAVGSRDGQAPDFRQSKIHIGLAGLF